LRPSPPNPLSQAGRGGDGRSIYDEDVPLKQDIYDYFEREVKPYVGDAWIDEAYKDEQDQQTGIVGYTINFNRYFYKHEPPEPLEAIEAKIKQLETEILALLQGS
jgi:type I restriction enzyme M protein